VYAREPVRYEMQLELLRLLTLLSRQFAAVALSLPPSSVVDAQRALVMCAMAALADAWVRLRACDEPSL
jgi:hypothetical protein